MDKRRSSWPWKKKSPASGLSAANQSDKGKHDDDTEKPKYVKISIESYNHLTGLEDQVDTLEDEVKGLNELLTEAHSEMTDKDNMVKQQAKVAEEAVAGWGMAETEASTLKTQLESMTLLKLTAEDRSSHLDGALKECMRQIRNLKEEHDQKLHDLVINKTNLFDKMKLGLESQISSLEQNLMNADADYSALSRSLQDRTDMLIKLRKEKSGAEADIEFLKTKIESCEKEINSLKYEVHVARKEVEIRSEEKDMSLRSLEVVNKQHLEGARKIAKLEAECQRLRTLVKKKLPGPGALAQMKLEVDNWCDPRLRRSHDSSLKWQKENELLMERLEAMDEHARALKEALENRDSELEASRSMCKLLEEAQVQTNGEGKRHVVANAEDGNADSVSCAGSFSMVSVSENGYFHKEKTTDSPQKPESAIPMELMNDFLEMEKLALASKVVKHEDDYVDQELEKAISCICDFVMNLGRDAKDIQGTSSDEDGLIENFSAKYTGAVKSKNELFDFVLDISRVLTRLAALKFNVPRLQSKTSSNSDCIDKIVLPENNCCPNNPSEFSDSASNPDTPNDGNLVPTTEQLKMDKDNLAVDYSRCEEDLEITKCLLVETEEVLADVRSQLASAQTSNGLAETQLKCMVESYRALEKRAEDLQTEVNFLQGKIVILDNELKEEKKSRQDAVTRCNDLLDKLERMDTSAAADNEKISQEEQDLASAAETLAECQETIFFLDKQLKALRPQTYTHSSPKSARGVSVSLEEEMSGVNHIHPCETDMHDSFNSDRTSSEPTLDHLLNCPSSPSESGSTRSVTKHSPTKSGSPSTPVRGFSRFFSSKVKNVHSVA